MKILSATQIREADAYTINQEPISSFRLMERAGNLLSAALLRAIPNAPSFHFFCGPGNNGGDGLVMACRLHQLHHKVVIYLWGEHPTEENLRMQDQAMAWQIPINRIHDASEFPPLPPGSIVVDALLGIGISRPAEGVVSSLIQYLNSQPLTKVAVDLPSGLSPDALFESHATNTIQASVTLTVQAPKLAFFFPENHQFTGEVEVVDIGLETSFIEQIKTPYQSIEPEWLSGLLHPRHATAHKGSFGHVLLMAGSAGKHGAAVLASRAAMRSGCGLLTTWTTPEVASALLVSDPEVMTIVRASEAPELPDLSSYQSIGLGPGLGVNTSMMELLKQLWDKANIPMVWDADAITLLSQHPEYYHKLHPQMILTPHPGEFDRLTQKHSHGAQRFKTQQEFSIKYHVVVVLKGHHTSVTLPDGSAWFNTTGNAGMATAGSGDVLTGIISALLAQGYAAAEAALLGVYLHGDAGDRAASKQGMISMNATDLITHLPEAFQALASHVKN